jgi:hypothetical protein
MWKAIQLEKMSLDVGGNFRLDNEYGFVYIPVLLPPIAQILRPWMSTILFSFGGWRLLHAFLLIFAT